MSSKSATGQNPDMPNPMSGLSYASQLSMDQAMTELQTENQANALQKAKGPGTSFTDQSGDLNNATDPSKNVAPPKDPNAPPDLNSDVNASGSAMNQQSYARSRAATILTSGRGLLGAGKSARSLLGF